MRQNLGTLGKLSPESKALARLVVNNGHGAARVFLPMLLMLEEGVEEAPSQIILFDSFAAWTDGLRDGKCTR
jgi:hypothetical protein